MLFILYYFWRKMISLQIKRKHLKLPQYRATTKVPLVQNTKKGGTILVLPFTLLRYYLKLIIKSVRLSS